jgi:Na+/proline symporter
MVSGGSSLLVIGITLVVFVVVGVRAHRRGADVEDYIVARNSQNALTLGLSFMAAGMGAWVLFAPPEVGATVGAVAVGGYAVGSAAPLAVFGLIGPRVRRVVPTGHSFAEFLGLRFGRAFHAYVVSVSILYMLFFVMAELTAIGAVMGLLSGSDPRIVVVAVAVATLAYTAYGGLRASLRTVAAAGTASRPNGWPVAVTLVIAVTAANMFHQGYWQRVWAARNDRTLGRGVVLGVVTTVPIVAVLGYLGIAAAARGVVLGSPPVPFFALLGGGPTWLGVVVLVLAISLVASSVDTLESGLASLVTAERPSTTLPQARMVTVALMVPAVVVAVRGYSVLQLFLIADLLCAATVVPALLSLWSRATSTAALVGAAAGLIGAGAAAALTDAGFASVTFPGGVPGLPPFAGALIASTAVAVAMSLASRRRTDIEALGAAVPALRG